MAAEGFRFDSSRMNTPPLDPERLGNITINSPQVRRLESDFPGLQNDLGVKTVFEDPDTGRVRVVQQASSESQVYLLGGEEDYTIMVDREDPEPVKGEASVDKSYYRFISIDRD